jgi:hypothetical protein
LAGGFAGVAFFAGVAWFAALARLAGLSRLAGLVGFRVFLVMIVSLNHKGARRAPSAIVVDTYYGVAWKLSREHPRLVRSCDP